MSRNAFRRIRRGRIALALTGIAAAGAAILITSNTTSGNPDITEQITETASIETFASRALSGSETIPEVIATVSSSPRVTTTDQDTPGSVVAEAPVADVPAESVRIGQQAGDRIVADPADSAVRSDETDVSTNAPNETRSKEDLALEAQLNQLLAFHNGEMTPDQARAMMNLHETHVGTVPTAEEILEFEKAQLLQEFWQEDRSSENPQLAFANPDNSKTRSARTVPNLKYGGTVASSMGETSGALSGRIVYTMAGHGWTYYSAGVWYTQRDDGIGGTAEVVEDLGNHDQVKFFAEYCLNAGATVVPLRPIGHQTEEVVVDNDDAGVTFTGTWNTSSSTNFYGTAGDVPYRYATTVTGTPTATARFDATIPQDGYYPTYVWSRAGSDRINQQYIIGHSGGTTSRRINHRMVGGGWIYVGTFHFEAGGQAYVEITNSEESGDPGSVVIADAVRFGNGMGDIARGGSTSGHPREEENGRYWAQESIGIGAPSSVYDGSGSDASDSVGAPPKLAAYMNREAEGGTEDRVYVSFHSNASSSASVRGADGLFCSNSGSQTPNGFNTPNGVLLAGLLGEYTNQGLYAMTTATGNPFEHTWGSTGVSGNTFGSGGALINAYGEIANYNNNEMGASIIEIGFHTNVQDCQLMRDAKVRDAAGRLNYHAVVDFFNQIDSGTLTFLPEPPTEAYLVSDSGGNLTLNWTPPVAGGPWGSGGDAPTGYVIYSSTNGKGFAEAATVSGGTTSSYNVTSLVPSGETRFFRVTATNAGGESFPSSLVGSRRDSAKARVLVVNGYSRQGRGTNYRQTEAAYVGSQLAGGDTFDRVYPHYNNSFDYAGEVGLALDAKNVTFDTVEDSQVVNSTVTLSDYDAVVYIFGEESSGDGTFTATEQTLVESYIAGGGNLFLSGSEVGWDLARVAATASNKTFFENTLGATRFSAGDPEDDANTYGVSGSTGSIFDGLSFSFSDGSGQNDRYDANFPDILVPFSAASSTVMTYTGGSSAAITVDGSGSSRGNVVFLGFPFETITSETARFAIMDAAMDYLLPAPAPSGFVQDFEGYAAGTRVTFWEPAWSGTSSGVNASTDAAEISTTQANNILDSAYGSGGSTSYRFAWDWTAAGSGFVRATSYNNANDPNPIINLTQGVSLYVKVASGEVDLGLWIRETGTSGTIGDNGGITGTVEELTSRQRISAAPNWQYVYFDLPNETYQAVNGNGTLDGDWGTLEALTFAAVAGSSATSIEVFVDDIHNGSQHTPQDPAPDAPAGLVATAGDGSVSLDWDNNGESDLDGYNVYRANGTGGPYTKLNGSLLAASAYSDTSVTNFTTYYYVVTAVDTGANESGNSSEASATPEDTTAPAAPTGLAATAGLSAITLDWSDNTEPDLGSYRVYRSTTSGSGYSVIATPASSGYTDTGISVGTTYHYVVSAVDNTSNANESGQSAEASAQVTATSILLQAEDYTSYNDTTTGNAGGQYRSDDVDIEVSSQGGYNVAYIVSGEWLEFSGILGNGSSYQVTADVAAASATGAFHIEINGVDATGLITFAATGGAQTWTTIDCGTVALQSGANTIRIVAGAADWNIDFLSFDAISQNPNFIDFDGYTIASYGGQDIDTTAYRLLDNGLILNMDGNTWKRITTNYTVTADTIVEFDYKSDSGEPEIGGVTLDNNDVIDGATSWKVFGTQAWGITTYDNYAFADNGWTHYVLPVGQTLSAGTYSYLCFINDFDGGTGSNSYFRNVRLREQLEVIVDNDGGAPGYTETGTWSTSASSGYNGGTYQWAFAGASETATWDLGLPESGTWTLFVQYRASGNRATSTAFDIQTASGVQTVSIDQTQNNLVWVELGSFDLDSSTATITLDASGSTGGTAVIADAVRAVR